MREGGRVLRGLYGSSGMRRRVAWLGLHMASKFLCASLHFESRLVRGRPGGSSHCDGDHAMRGTGLMAISSDSKRVEGDDWLHEDESVYSTQEMVELYFKTQREVFSQSREPLTREGLL